MAAMTMPRQPFGELGPAQLQQLSSTKNRQNAITDTLSKAGQFVDKPTSVTSKRPLEPFVLEDEDAENVDPASFSPKRSKGALGTPSKKPMFVLNDASTPSTGPGAISCSNLASSSSQNSIAGSGLCQKRKAESSCTITTPMSAPAGRSPKHKRVGILSKKRSSFSPFRRIDPPLFGPGKPSEGSLPFSIDEALSGTLSNHSAKAKAPTIEESMPKNWLFDIHEDTPEQEATNMMEHSACTLDISDDEDQLAKHGDRGKENIPPVDYHQEAPVSPLEEKATKSRRLAAVDAMLDDGEDRLPLGDLPAADFYDEGLNADSKVVIALDDENIKGCGAEQPRGETAIIKVKGLESSQDILVEKPPEDSQNI